jgi:uncharacterized membrane protein YraQ (UPF0718 family)
MALLTETTEIARKVWKIDRVVLAIVGVAVVLIALVPDQAGRSVVFTGEALVGILPFLIVSVLVAAFAKATGLDKQIAIAFSGHPMRAVFLAAAFGALSPFCSCGVVPIIAGLLGAGVPLAPVMAFWLASPLMDPQMFFLMIPVFGLPFTVAKLLAAFGIGAAAGIATHMFARQELFANPMLPGAMGCGSGCGVKSPLAADQVVWKFWGDTDRRQAFVGEGKAIGWFLFKWLTLAFELESLMVAYIPAERIAESLGGAAWWAIPASVVLGVPAYLNGFAAIPTVSALIDMGMAPGAGLGFMVAGGVTSIPAAMAVFALVKRPVFIWYLVWGLAGSLAVAYGFQAYVMLGG